MSKTLSFFAGGQNLVTHFHTVEDLLNDFLSGENEVTLQMLPSDCAAKKSQALQTYLETHEVSFDVHEDWIIIDNRDLDRLILVERLN
ncbi:MAG: hypothetical protein ACK53X_09015 [Holosporales bacterium]